MATPFTQRSQKIIDGFIFGPEVPQKIVRVSRKDDTLLPNEFFNRRMSLASILPGN
jgi:hypothetical protein